MENEDKNTSALKDGRIGVAFLISTLAMGGAERATLDLISQLEKSKYGPVLCCMKCSRAYGNAEKMPTAGFPENLKQVIEKIPLYEGLSPSRFDARVFFRLLRIYKKHNIKIVFAVGGRDVMFWTPLTGIAARIPVKIGVFHSMRSEMFIYINKLLLRFFDAIIAVAKAQADFLLEHTRFSAQRVHVIHNGIDCKLYEDDSRRKALRSELGISDEAPVIGIVATLSKIKSHHIFLKMASIVSKQYSTARFLIIGDGGERESLLQLQKALQLEEKVIFLGHRTDIPDLLSALDLFVLSSASEAFPISILEAMAAAKPVVATDVGAISEMVTPGETGYLVPPGSPELLAEAVCSLLSDRAKAERLGIAGRQRVRERFSSAQNTQATIALLDQLTDLKGVSS